MDALALLCTLHADGPATLRRLHRSGCSSLQGLETFSPEELADLLTVEPAAARRLAREARLLRARIDDGVLDREESAVPADRVAPVAAGTSGAPLAAGDRALLGRVLERWRERDGSEPAPEPPAAIPPAPRPRLSPGAVDGLDAVGAEALAAAGIGTLADLADADPLEIARLLGASFARARRVQYLAARRVDAGAVVEEPRVPPVVDVPQAAAPLPPPPPAAPAPARAPAGLVLDWNFELPTPTRPAPASEDASGPFA